MHLIFNVLHIQDRTILPFASSLADVMPLDEPAGSESADSLLGSHLGPIPQFFFSSYWLLAFSA